MEEAAREELPPTLTTGFQGTAQEFQKSARGLGLLLIAAVVVIYLVMGMLYESFIHPITILSGLPSAGVGALLTLALFGSELNLYSMVGLIMLIGIVKKNAIMMIDFALDAERTRGEAAGGGDLRGVAGAVPADHDDDDVRAAGAHCRSRWAGARGGVAQAARAGGGRRPAGVAGADAVLHPGLLHLPRQAPVSGGRGGSSPGRRNACGPLSRWNRSCRRPGCSRPPRLCLGTHVCEALPRGSLRARQSLAGCAFPGRAWERELGEHEKGSHHVR